MTRRSILRLLALAPLVGPSAAKAFAAAVPAAAPTVPAWTILRFIEKEFDHARCTGYAVVAVNLKTGEIRRNAVRLGTTRDPLVRRDHAKNLLRAWVDDLNDNTPPWLGPGVTGDEDLEGHEALTLP